MDIEVLLSTMHQNDLSIINKMNINTKAIIINQCDNNSFIESENGFVKMYSFKERGIGRSRNNALMRSTAEICVLADDDMKYVENYKEIIFNAFKKNPKADVIIFNVSVFDENGKVDKVKKNGRVRIFNSLKYGAVSVAFKREKIYKKNIFFSLLFGGGAIYSAGEDSLFISDCLKKGLKIYSNTTKIADVYNYESTWFTGYNEKFFFDKGVFFATFSKYFSYPLLLQYALRKHNVYKGNMGLLKAINHMKNGIKMYKTN